jgi:hypothetical protein
MLKLSVTRQEIDNLKRLQVKYRWDRLIPFSVNWQRKTWVFESWGLTPEENRRVVGGFSGTLDTITDEYLRIRENGGRFFLDRGGAYYKDRDGGRIPFVTFVGSNKRLHIVVQTGSSA